MKRLITIIIFTFYVCVTGAFADIATYTEKFNGPVKKMTVTSVQAGSPRVWIYWYDSIGRLTEKVVYMDGFIQHGFLRQYTINNVYMDYDYNEKGVIKGSFTQTQLDSLGHKLQSKIYKEGKLWRADSIVYNAQGNEIECYTMDDDGILVLRHTCEYDSLNRLIKKYNNLRGNEITFTFEYLDDGNYMEYRTSTNSQKTYKKYIFNKQGQLVRVKGSKENSQFKKFDTYGNWTIWEEMLDAFFGRISYTYERVFEYYE